MNSGGGGAVRGEQGDVLLGKEKDSDGRLHGVKLSSGQKCWFPAVYVDQVSEARALVKFDC